MRTSFTELVGCRFAVQQAGFESINIALAAAVSKAGGLGTLGASYVSAEELSKSFGGVREQTDAPVAVSFATPFFDAKRDADTLEVAIDQGAVVEFFSAPSPDSPVRV